MKTLTTLSVVVLLASCTKEEEPDLRPVYNIEPYETLSEHLYVIDDSTTVRPVQLTTEQEGFAQRYRTNQFPEYLELLTIRAFKRLDSLSWEVTIQQRDGSPSYTDTVWLDQDGMSFTQLPQYYYDVTLDYVYQCYASCTVIRGPASTTLTQLQLVDCDTRDHAAVASSQIHRGAPLDSLLVSYVALPYRQ